MQTARVFITTLVALLVVAALGALASKEPPTKLSIGVKYRPQECERKSKAGDRLSMHYTGSLYEDGTVFDSSLQRGQPFEFNLGSGQVIKGWDQGLIGMCVGEKRKLVIPPDLGYGDRGAPPKIPPKATLVFEVECVAVNGA